MFGRWALPLLEAVHSAFWCQQKSRQSRGEGGPEATSSRRVEWVRSPFWPGVFSLHFIAQLGSNPFPSPHPHPQ